MRRVTAVLALVGLVAVFTACGDGRGAQHVTTVAVSHPSIQDVRVFAPTSSDGPWPVVIAFHGIGGTADDMAEFASRVAGKGFVVFAPTYRSDVGTPEGRDQAARDGECAYRYARSIAGRYGGDLDQPVTFVGWSLGASLALALGLTEHIDPTGEMVSCFTDVPRPDIVVAISGCHYEHGGAPTGFLDHSGWDNKDADVVLLAGERDTTCTAWQSTKAATELRAAGFDVRVVTLADASHFAPVFHKSAGDGMSLDRDAAAGRRAVDLVVDAVSRRRAGG